MQVLILEDLSEPEKQECIHRLWVVLAQSTGTCQIALTRLIPFTLDDEDDATYLDYPSCTLAESTPAQTRLRW